MQKKESELDQLKKNFAVLQKKYSLPNFKQLNEDFEIEKLSGKETDMLLREIRKLIVDKVLAYLRFLELLMNPTSAPMFFLAIVKTLSVEDKKLVENLYKSMASVEFNALDLDNRYSEKTEAEFIKNTYSSWQETKTEFSELAGQLKATWNKKSTKKERGYFG